MVITLALEAKRLPFLIEKRKHDVTLMTREKDLLSLLYESQGLFVLTNDLEFS